MIMSPGLIFVQKAILPDVLLGGAYFRRGLLLAGILHFKMARVGLDNKNSLKTYENSLKQLALTAGLIIGRIFVSKIWGGGLIFRRACWGGKGYRSFTVSVDMDRSVTGDSKCKYKYKPLT